ncbi:patatin-like phospholipase family protein [Celeribacter indicus]|uniref:Phospholipase-like protein n=1 Tax=Celeribacter indicus TaxID=1208324 RepID=A0A0B5E4I0_9RHOB|nr:patatin-like phospholipase family protein [Celeribacter indicus]AJE47262.1 phospholipase-like protein [Celeribacter indicus]SDW01924.1 NTE family protein [Celeribacter indicus]
MAGAKTVKRINLALQGGGAHGAFTWGVLDRLLDHEEIEIAGISGTSAGALNGAALRTGLLRGGREGAREALNALWEKMGAVSDMRINAWMTQFGPTTAMMTKWLEASLPFSFFGSFANMSSPYHYGPFYKNPLKPIVEDLDCSGMDEENGPRLYISTTNVRTGKIRVFSNREVTTEVILASACLPELFQAVEMTDPETGITDAFWDGGYTGNPALFPLFEPDLPQDVVIVNINPLERPGTPTTPEEIQNRINEISFNSSMLRELRAIQFVRELIAEKRVSRGSMKDVLVHMISDDALMQDLSARTKLVPSPFLLSRMKGAGQAACDAFLEAHFDKIGTRASVNLREMFA